MGHRTESPRAEILHALGHAATATAFAYLVVLIALEVVGLPWSDTLLIGSGAAGLVPGIVQETIDTRFFRHWGWDSTRDLTNYTPILGVSLLFAGQWIAGFAVLGLAIAAETTTIILTVD